MDYVQIPVAQRSESGSAAVRRLRRTGQVPGVLYGLGRPNLHLALPLPELERFLRSGSHLVELRMGDKTRPAILRELQMDPVTDELLHTDFLRVRDDVEVEDTCRVLFRGRPKGAGEGGIFEVLLETVDVRARPRLLPGEVTVEVSALTIGAALHARDLVFEQGVTLLTPGDAILCHVTTPPVVVTAPEPELAAESAAAGEAAVAETTAAEKKADKKKAESD